jgi:hypothetical protein
LDFRLAYYQLFFDNLSNFHGPVICKPYKVNPIGQGAEIDYGLGFRDLSGDDFLTGQIQN